MVMIYYYSVFFKKNTYNLEICNDVFMIKDWGMGEWVEIQKKPGWHELINVELGGRVHKVYYTSFPMFVYIRKFP